MIPGLKTVTAHPSSLHRSRSRNPSPFLTLAAAPGHRGDHDIVDRLGLPTIRAQVRHPGFLPSQRMRPQTEPVFQTAHVGLGACLSFGQCECPRLEIRAHIPATLDVS